MRPIAWTLLAAMLVLALSPTASAQEGTDALTIVATESGCERSTFCFQTAKGNLSALSPGDEVELTLRNEGSNVHNLFVSRAADADPAHRDTRRADAISGTDDLGHGETVELRFTVPPDADGLYLWCDVPGHEGGGMWLEVSFGPEGELATGETTQQAPAFGPLAALAGLAAAAVARIGWR